MVSTSLFCCELPGSYSYYVWNLFWPIVTNFPVSILLASYLLFLRWLRLLATGAIYNTLRYRFHQWFPLYGSSRNFLDLNSIMLGIFFYQLWPIHLGPNASGQLPAFSTLMHGAYWLLALFPPCSVSTGAVAHCMTHLFPYRFSVQWNTVSLCFIICINCCLVVYDIYLVIIYIREVTYNLYS